MIGSGTYGKVLAHTDHSLCIKRFSPNNYTSMIRELYYIGLLSSVIGITDIISYSTSYRNKNSYYIDMTMIKYKCTLKEWIRTNPSFDDRLQIFIRILNIMAQVHKLGIIHADIKLENIMLNSLNDIRIIDWGLSGTSDTALFNLTTKIYRSPYFSNTPYHDIYSLGILGIELLTSSVFTSVPTYKFLKKFLRRKILNENLQSLLLSMVSPLPPSLSSLFVSLPIPVPHPYSNPSPIIYDNTKLIPYNLHSSHFPEIFNIFLSTYHDQLYSFVYIYYSITNKKPKSIPSHIDLYYILSFFSLLFPSINTYTSV